MKNNIRNTFILAFLIFGNLTNLHAQFLNCDAIQEEDLICSFSMLNGFTGTMNAEDSGGIQPNPLCPAGGAPHNISWFGFKAQAGEYYIKFSFQNCTSDMPEPGIQIGMYTDCTFTESVYCDPNCTVNEVTISSSVLVPGQIYYLFIDGCFGTVCDYSFEIVGSYENDLQLSGNSFIDYNSDGIQNGLEPNLANANISLDYMNMMTLSDDNGHFSFSDIPEGTYTITASISEGEWLEDEVSFEYVHTGDCESAEIGFVPEPSTVPDALVSITNSIARCDGNTKFYITIQNLSSDPLDGTFQFDFDDKTTFVTSDIPNISVNNNVATASTGVLEPFEFIDYLITLKMPPVSDPLPELEFAITVFDNAQTSIAEYAYTDLLRCSYDPNDKKEFPDRPGEENYTLFEEDLEYKIRFQNNGNDTAFQVRIVDEMDPNIDLSSLRIINSSHPVSTSITGATVEFLFEDIMLVDSMTNYDDSQGFVTFRCNVKTTTAENTIVTNQAEIIFDSNPPIITNSTINTFVSELCTSVTNELDINICEGFSFMGYDSTGIYTIVDPLEFGCDSTTIINLTVREITLSNLDLEVCEGDPITINEIDYLFTESTEFIDTTLDNSGCIDVLTNVNVTVYPSQMIQIDTTICEGMDYNGLTVSGTYTFDSLDAVTGCDVLYSIDLFVEDVVGLEFVPIEICTPSQISVLGNDYFIDSSVMFTDTIYSEAGCVDTIFSVEVNLIPSQTSIDTTICEGMEYNGLSETGIYTYDSFDSISGCDLIVTLDLLVLPITDPACIVGIDDLVLSDIKLYPNPAQDLFYIESDSEIKTVSIYSLSFQKIEELSFKNRLKKIELSTGRLGSGLYVIAIKTGGKISYKKLIVE